MVGLLAACGTTGRIQLPPGAERPQPVEPNVEEENAAPTWFSEAGQSQAQAEETTAPDTPLPDRVVPQPDPQRPKFNDGSPVGTNLGRVTPTSRDRAFVDLFKRSTPWVSVTAKKWDDGRVLVLDDEGWVRSLEPQQFAATQMLAHKGGRYVATYEGLGVLEVDGKVKVLSDKAGRLEFQAQPKSTITLILRATNPTDPLRRLKVVPVALEKTEPVKPFNPDFLAAAKRFSTLRFADWTRADSSEVVAWKERTKPGSARQSGAEGVAYEYMIQLANELRADLWMTVPAQADDAHVTALATLIKANLEPELRVYVEYGHRMTVPRTPGFRHASRQGQALKLATDEKTAALRYYARRSAEVFDLFGAVYNKDPRLVRVVAGSSYEPKSLEAMLAFEKTGEQADALAIDARLGEGMGTPEWQTQIRRHDVPWLLDQVEQQSLPALLGRVQNASQVAQRFDLRLVAFDFGLALRAGRQTKDKLVEQRFDEANRSSRMTSLYGALLDGWRQNGGELVQHSALASKYGRRGRRGAVEYIDRLKTPKYQALMAFIDRSPRWWSPIGDLAVASPSSGLPEAPDISLSPPTGPGLSSEANAQLTAPGAQAGVVAREPGRDRTAIWTVGGAGVAAFAASAAFLGLYLDTIGERDLLLSQNPSVADGQEARQLDDQAFTYSLLAGVGAGVAGASLGTAIVLSMVEPERRPGQAESTNPWPWLTAASSLIAAGAGTAYLISHFDAIDQRNEQFDANGGSSAPLRVLDDQAFSYSLLAAIGYVTAAAAAAAAVYMFVGEGTTLDYDMNLKEYFESGGVIISPTGVHVRW